MHQHTLSLLTSAVRLPRPQVCQAGWFAANVLHHPLRLQQLLNAFLEAFAFDASCAGMLLYAAAPPVGAATCYAPGSQSTEAAAGATGSQGSSGADAPVAGSQQQAQLAAASGVVLLPRMPLGLALVTTAKTYEAVAAALRAAATLAAAADAAPGSSGTALRTLVDGCLSRLQQLLTAAQGSGGSSGQRAHKRSRQEPAVQPAADMAGPGQAPWQLQAAGTAVVLAELLLGASPAWQPSWSVSAAAEPAAVAGGAELELLAAAVVQELVAEAIWSLPTSVPAAGPDVPGSVGSGGSVPLLEAAAGQQGLSVQVLGCNALLQRAALECCGTAARALGPRFAQNGRLLRTALLPLLEKLGKWQDGQASCCCSVQDMGLLQELVPNRVPRSLRLGDVIAGTRSRVLLPTSAAARRLCSLLLSADWHELPPVLPSLQPMPRRW